MASITMIQDGAPATVGASHQGALAVDETQYADGQGPCVHAARTAELVRVDDVGSATAFEKWRVTAKEIGVTTAASIPIPSSPEIAAALNLYSLRQGGGWPQGALADAETLAEYAGDAITIAYRQRWSQRRHR